MRATLDSVIVTSELDQRPARVPDGLAQSRALVDLMKSLKAPDPEVLQKLSDTAMLLCCAHSAGISIAERQDELDVFRWHACSGRWKPFLGGTIARNASACGIVLDRRTPLLMRYPERHFEYAMEGLPPLVEALLVPFDVAGETVGTVWIVVHDEARCFDREDLRLLLSLAEFASVAWQLVRQERQIREALNRQLIGSQILQSVSVDLIAEGDASSLHEKILQAARVIMQSAFASLQMVDRDGQLRLLASTGFHPRSAEFWRIVRLDSKSSCGATLRARQRYMIADTEHAEELVGSEDLDEYRRSGIRSMQSTPLITRSGRLVGVVSTHWREPHTPPAGALQLFDVLAREAADLIERTRVEAELREADRRKDEFLAVLGHELRNPLAPLSMGIELLQRASTEPKLVDGIHSMMKRQLAHLTRIVNDLLDLSRLTRGQIDLQSAPLDLRLAIEAAVDLTRPLINQRGHRLQVEHGDMPLSIDGDLERLTQVVANLLSNAAKYMDAGGEISLRATQEDGDAVLRVRDAGFGIPAQHLDRIFEMFAQVPEHRVQRGGGGLGIGLALSRRIVELHGGSLTAASQGSGCGSEFTIRLPAAVPTAVANSGADDAGIAPERLRIMIVDDNVDAATSLRAVLELSGHTAEIAHDGIESLALFDRFKPEVCLLDIGLPRMDGYQLARQIRSLADGGDVLLIAVTGWGQSADRDRARDAGFDVHMTKPVDLEALMAALTRKGD